MTPTSQPMPHSPARAVIAWEAPAGATIEHQLDALAGMGAHLGGVAAGIMVPGSLLAASAAQVAEVLGRHGLRAVPYFDLRAPDAATHRQLSQLAGAFATPAVAKQLYASGDVRYAIASVNDNGPDPAAMVEARAAITAGGADARLGWVRRTSAFGVRPPALDYVVDFPPYGDVHGGTEDAQRYSYSVLVSDLARRYAGDDVVVPSVLWASGNEARVADSGWIVNDISSLKIAYAIDAARRFILNRLAHGAPFWMLRVAFDPRRPADLRKLGGLADMLRLPHVPSATLGKVADLPAIAASGARVAVVLHLYYPDLWDELAEAIERLPERFDLFVSCPFRVASAMRVRVGRRFPRAVVFGVHNLGRDVLPFLLWLRAGGAVAYTYVLKLHGKKSVHMADTSQAPFGGGEAWRRQALDGLIGSDSHVRALLAAMDATPGIGLVAAQGQLYDQVAWKCGTADLVATTLERLGIPDGVSGNFPAGTMFWARLAALAPLANLPDAALDFEREAGQVDGTLHHAYERMVALVAAFAGFETTDSRALLSAQAVL
jgi:hypothetical protein